jgi:hypothetical protein
VRIAGQGDATYYGGQVGLNVALNAPAEPAGAAHFGAAQHRLQIF